MSVQILHEGGQAVLYCSTSNWAFGPVFHDPVDARGEAEAFCAWLRGERSEHVRVGWIVGDGTDPRDYSDACLERLYLAWHASKTEVPF